MQCVGTLSWSVVGLAPPLRPSRHKLEPRGPGAPKQPVAGHVQDGTMVKQGKLDGPDAFLTHGEVRPLEIDWSQVVRRCIDGDSGAWAELVKLHHRRGNRRCYR